MDILCGISKEFYLDVKIQEPLNLRAHNSSVFFKFPPWKTAPLL